MSESESVNLLLNHLDLEVVLDYESGTLQGKATLSLRNDGPDPVEFVPLQLGRLMSVQEARGGGDIPLPFSQDVVIYRDEPRLQVNQVHVQLTEQLPPQQVFSIQVAYSGVLVGYTEVGWRYVRDHVDPEFTILREDAFAFPVLGLPSMASRKAMPREDFSFIVRITVPSGLTVALGAEEEGIVQDNGFSTWAFKSRAPVPFLNIAIAKYQRISDRGVVVFHFPADVAGAQRLMTSVHRVIDLYSEWFGPLDERPQFHIIEIPEGWGSQASLTAGIILTADSFKKEKGSIGLYHELAHLWHPHDLEIPSPRWNEGLATFLQHRVAQELEGGEHLTDRMARVWNSMSEQLERVPDVQSVPMIEYGKYGLTDSSYGVGCLLFYALSEVLGQQQFDRVLGQYFQTYRRSGTTTAELVNYVAAHVDTDTKRAFEDWLCTANWAKRLLAGESLREVMKSYHIDALTQ